MGKKKKKGKKIEKIKREISWNYIFSYGNNLALNSLIAIFLVSLAVLIILYHRQLSLRQEQLEKAVTIFKEAEGNRTKAGMSSWQKYQNLWYGFELRYPLSWKEPVDQDASVGVDWEYRYAFRKKDPGAAENSCQEKTKKINIADWQLKYLFYKKEAEENNQYGGFDLVIYDTKEARELSDAGKLTTITDQKSEIAGICSQIEGYMVENENYPAEKIHILSEDDCRNSIFFYSLIREGYAYSIVPVFKEDPAMSIDSRKEAIDNFPELFSIASSFNLIDIKRPKIVPRKPRITAPQPIAVTKSFNGKRICAKKNDKPGKSNKNKGKHMDMECCLDPDEYPNPWCYYFPNK